MELEKGVCFSCDGKSPILKDQSEKIQQSFLCLYTETTLNVEKLQSILPSLKLCPICFHQLIILKKIHECIEANKHINAEDCVFCKKGDFTFKISKWNHLEDISDDFPVFSDENKHEICSQCCFYLDRRNFLKRRLFTKYPHLRVVPKLKLKFGSELTTHSTPLKNKSKHASEKMSDSETIYISDDQSPKGLDMSSIKSFRALKTIDC
ncbi:hypothetical protein JTB14_031092 [Gonioctena quinquepunctata]|nr:hypothetical protein JTB14_031092 [Gonioctena quinquepunctata]